MLKSYFKIAWRNLWKNKLYSFVNILGLTIGITSCIFLGLYIGDELSYDQFHKKADRIARVTMEYSNGGTIGKYAQTGTKAGPQFTRVFPAIEAFTRTFKFGRIVSDGNKTFDEKNFLFADSSFFQIFSFSLLRGNPKTVLSAPKQMVLTQKMAKKYFGNKDPIGKTLRIGNADNFTITGISQDPPGNSQIKFDFVASFLSLDAAGSEEWWTANYITYLLLYQPGQLDGLRNQISNLMKTPQVRKEARLEGNDYLTYHLEPLKKVHLFSALDGLEPNGSITYVYVLGVIGMLILIIACVNYTNLATAQSAGRNGEISIRKVMGAHQWQVFMQYLGESALLSVIALLLALILCMEFLPLFNSLSGKTLSATLLLRPVPLLSISGLALLVCLLSGAYPAFVLSNAKLISLLKSGFSFSSAGSGLRKSLIVFQFVISVFLMISTIIIVQQLSFIRNKKLGYDRDHIIVLPVDQQMRGNYDAIKNQIKRNPQVLNVGGAYESPTQVNWGDGIQADNGTGQKNLSITCLPSDLDLIKTLNMQIIAGTDFTPADLRLMDTSNNYKNYHYTFILNESAVKAIGWKPSEAIGKTINKGAPGTIKAVVKDFNFTSLHQPIGPLMLFLDTQYIHTVFVKISGKDIPATINYLQAVWKERAPYRPFEYHFLDDDYNALYQVETRTGQLFGAFSAIAILLACLGLFALAAFTTMQRTKEIGIRKVLGASLINITGLISWDFLKLVLIAAVLAIPLAWWAVHIWLDDFAYRIEIQIWVFFLALLAALLIALITVSFQAIKAAVANPVDALRSE